LCACGELGVVRDARAARYRGNTNSTIVWVSFTASI